MKDTKTIQTLASVSLIGGPLSIIVGGVLLSTAALVCGVIAFVMLRKMTSEDGVPSDAILQALTRQAIIGMAVSGLALVMNAASVIMMLPAIMDAMQTGDYSSLLNGGSSAGDASGSADSGGAFGGGSSGSTSESAQGGKSSVWG